MASFVIGAVGAPVSQRQGCWTHRTRRAPLAPGLHSLSLPFSKSRSVSAAKRHQGIITCKKSSDESAQVVTESVDEGENVVCTETGVCMTFEEVCEVDMDSAEEKCGYYEVSGGGPGDNGASGGGGGGGGGGWGGGEWQRRLEGALLLTVLAGAAYAVKSAVDMLCPPTKPAHA